MYNAASTIGALIENVLREIRMAVKLIIVNDSSTDATRSIISKYTDKRLVVLEQDNQGVYAARNAALAEHRGE